MEGLMLVLGWVGPTDSNCFSGEETAEYPCALSSLDMGTPLPPSLLCYASARECGQRGLTEPEVDNFCVDPPCFFRRWSYQDQESHIPLFTHVLSLRYFVTIQNRLRHLGILDF